MTDAPLLKDFIDRDSITAVVAAIGEHAPQVDVPAVVDEIMGAGWDDMALKQRIRRIAVVVRSYLPASYSEALRILCTAATHIDAGWMSLWAFNDFVEEFGVDYPEDSLPALEQFTKLASAEFAVRPFIRSYPDMMAEQMLAWAASDDPAVRRLASEGFRPRLPWGMGLPALKKDPSPILPVLARLRSDPSEDVRRSVANNLNDISKDHPEVVVELLSEWGVGEDGARSLRKHALRTLVKAGHPDALRLLGFSPHPEVRLADVSVRPMVAKVGASVQVEFVVESTSEETQRLMIDYAVTYQNASGSGSRKVFKGSIADVEPSSSITVTRKVSLAQRTTRKVFPGPHGVEVQVNGAVLGDAWFEVEL